MVTLLYIISLFATCSKAGQWVKGANGQTCNDVCALLSPHASCNADKQSTITTSAAIKAAFAEAGYECKGVKDSWHRDYAGAPLSTGRWDDCYFLTPGSKSVCDDNRWGGHSALCYCETSVLRSITYIGMANVQTADILYDFEFIGRGSCWMEGQVHPTFEVLSEADNSAETCAQACIDNYGEYCSGFDTRVGCLIYKKEVATDAIVASRDYNVNGDCYAIKGAGSAAGVAPNNMFAIADTTTNNGYDDYDHYLVLLLFLSNVMLVCCVCIMFKRMNNIKNEYKYGKAQPYTEADVQSDPEHHPLQQ